jgi:hypothetical protein
MQDLPFDPARELLRRAREVGGDRRFTLRRQGNSEPGLQPGELDAFAFPPHFQGLPAARPAGGKTAGKAQRDVSARQRGLLNFQLRPGKREAGAQVAEALAAQPEGMRFSLPRQDDFLETPGHPAVEGEGGGRRAVDDLRERSAGRFG